MKRLNLARDSVLVTVRGAKPERVLSACAAQGIRVRAAKPVEDNTMQFHVSSFQVGKVKRIAEQKQCKVVRVQYSRTGAFLRGGLRRRFLLFLLAAACLLAWLSSLFVWEIRVDGNERVSSAEIIRAMEACGVTVGTFWPATKPDIVRAGVQLRVPELDWFTMNLRGSVAEVHVLERVEPPEVIDNDAPYELYAARSGVIVRMTILQGQPVAQRGEFVTAGQTIVSGAPEDFRGARRGVHALGSVRARTAYSLTAQLPLTGAETAPGDGMYTRWSLVCGKKRVNFGKSSSISDGFCDKIESVYVCAIPGLVRLPVSLVREDVTPLRVRTVELDRGDVRARLEHALFSALRDRIGEDGEIITQHISESEADGVLTVTLRCECEQEIALPRPCDVPNTPMEEEQTDD